MFQLRPDGMLSNPPQQSYTVNASSSLARSLISAIEHCQPYDMLTASKYPQWKSVLMQIRIEHAPPPAVRSHRLPIDPWSTRG